MNSTEIFLIIYGVGIILAIPFILIYNKMYKQNRTPLKVALLSYVAVIAFLMATIDNLINKGKDNKDFFEGL